MWSPGPALLPFAETDVNDPNFGALVLDIENWLTHEEVKKNGTTARELRTGAPETFKALVQWVDDQIAAEDQQRAVRNHHPATWKKLHRRLNKMVYESRGVLRYDDKIGSPLNLVCADTSDPIVVDLAALAGQPDLQRFVVATVLRQCGRPHRGAGGGRAALSGHVGRTESLAPRGRTIRSRC